MNNAIKNSEIEVTKRSIYNGGRRSATYDARGTLRGVEFSVTAKSKKEAIEAAKAEIEFMLSAGSFEAGGCAVRPSGFQSWDFVLPGRCVMSYGAASLQAAIDYAAWSYRDHADAAAFLLAVQNRRCDQLGLSHVDAQ